MNVNNGVLDCHLFASDISALQCHTSKYVCSQCNYCLNVKEVYKLFVSSRARVAGLLRTIQRQDLQEISHWYRESLV